MELLKTFGEIDPSLETRIRPSVRAIIVNPDKTLHMVTSIDEDFCFPGGGIEPGESHVDALARELREEMGYKLDMASVHEFCRVDMIKPDRFDAKSQFLQMNYYYFCSGEKVYLTELSDNEIRLHVRAVDITVADAIAKNEECINKVETYERVCFTIRDTCVLNALRDRKLI